MFMSEKIALRTLCQYLNGEMDDREHLIRKLWLATEELTDADQLHQYYSDKEKHRGINDNWGAFWKMIHLVKNDDLEALAAMLVEMQSR